MEETGSTRRVYRGDLSKRIVENAHTPNPLSPQELADAYGFSVKSIHQTMVRLRRQGRIPLSSRQNPRKRPEPVEPQPDSLTQILSKPPSEWSEGDMAAIDALPILTPDQRKKLLSAIGMRPAQGVGQSSALKILDDMDKAAKGGVGPPEPLTEEDRIVRLSRLMKAVGPQTSQKAMEAAFGQGSAQEIVNTSEAGPPSDGQSDVA